MVDTGEIGAVLLSVQQLAARDGATKVRVEWCDGVWTAELRYDCGNGCIVITTDLLSSLWGLLDWLDKELDDE